MPVGKLRVTTVKKIKAKNRLPRITNEEKRKLTIGERGGGSKETRFAENDANYAGEQRIGTR